uniref:Arf-GAP domain-containing protein n=1 Tax=Alexandrium monilatum TaxID=311494 RepID=A0A7S4QYP8_9DINO
MSDKNVAMNMPPDVEARIRAMPGNQTCADCSNIKPQWASVTYGTLVCLECSGQHRSLGVHLSFVRSVQMDAWKPDEIARMEKSGGNQALVEYLSSRGIDKGWPIAAKYNTKQAAYFKERLTRWVQGKTEPPPDPGRYDPVSGGDAQGAEPLPGETTDEYNARQARLRERARERLRQKFGDKGMGGVGSEPTPTTNEGLDIGGLGRFVGGAVGGAVCGVGNFLKSNVIENEGLHSTLRGTVGAVGETAGGAWSSIRRSIGDSDTVGGLVGGLKRHTIDEDGALRQGLGWTAGAVGSVWEKASNGIGDLMADGSGGQATPGAPTCSKGHMLRAEPRSDMKCSLCSTRGTRYCCSQGCRYDICTKCWEKPKGPNQKNSMSFDDDEWGSGWEDPSEKAPPPEPTKDDINKMAQDLGMKLSAGPAPVSSPGGGIAAAQRPRSETAPAASAAPAQQSPDGSPKRTVSGALGAGATPAKPKKKGLDESDDFFSEFGL